MTTIICSFCAKPIQEPDHPCPHKLYSLTNIVAQAKDDSPALLGSITNLVFQGGGIKGLAYLGALQQLQREKKDFLNGVHRVAGTSAGSMIALYLGLNLDVDNDIARLMKRKYSELLDDGLVLKVAVNLDAWWGIKGWMFGDQYKNFTVKDILLTAMKFFEDLETELNSGDPKAEAQATKDTEDMVEAILKYYGTKLGTAYSMLMKVKASSFAADATKWLINMLKPPPKEDDAPLVRSTDPSEIHPMVRGTAPRRSGKSKFEEIVDNKCTKALIDCKEAKVVESKDKLNSSFLSDSTDNSPPTARKVLKMGARSVAAPASATEIKVNPPSSHEKQVNAKKEKEANVYLDRKMGATTVKADDASELKGTTLYNALGELLWFCIISQQNAAGVKQQLGLFTGSVVKKELIEDPIKKRITELGLEPKDDITFQELWDLNEKLPEEKRFKKFYVTSFNMELLRTEVFSVDHTPNVVIADAVRASMSIPVFFTPVTIRERTAEGLTERQSYSNDNTHNLIHYMDGGVLDNYPIWIFDDFKYCVQDIPEFKPPMRYSLQNPHTLGFRLLDKKIIDIYTNPYFDPERKRMKQINANKYEGTFSYQMGLLANTEVNQAQENEHIKRGDMSRSVYVDNKGISAVAFSLSDADITLLVNSGVESILNYKSRAALNGFIGEGQAYF